MMMEVLTMVPDDNAVRESIIHCLGDLASHSNSISALSDPKCVRLVLSAAKESAVGTAVAFGNDDANAVSSKSMAATVKSVRTNARGCCVILQHTPV